MDTAILGSRIQRFREARGLTQEELAFQAGISVKHVSVLERGVKIPRLETFVAIANVLGVLPCELLLENNEEYDYLKAINAKVAILPADQQKKLYKIICAVIETF